MLTHSCLTPRSNHLLMVRQSTPGTLEVPEQGAILNAAYIHAMTGEVVRQVQVKLQGPRTIYLFPSRKEAFAGWAYVVMWSVYFQRYGCSCAEGRSQGWCEHIQAVEEPVIVA